MYLDPYRRYNSNYDTSNVLEKKHRWKVALVLGLFFIFLMVFLNELSPEVLSFGSEVSKVKVLQLDKLADIKEQEHEGTWNFSTWKYFETLEPVIRYYHVAAEDIQSGRVDDTTDSKGFWVLGTTDNGTDGDINNFIRLSNFHNDDTQDVSIGLTFFLEGPVALEIRIWSGKTKKESEDITFTIRPEGMFFNYGLCSEIINIPFGSYVYQVEMKAILYNEKAFAAIDKIVAVVGTMSENTNLMYTMLPNDWCHKIGKKLNTP